MTDDQSKKHPLELMVGDIPVAFIDALKDSRQEYWDTLTEWWNKHDEEIKAFRDTTDSVRIAMYVISQSMVQNYEDMFGDALSVLLTQREIINEHIPQEKRSESLSVKLKDIDTFIAADAFMAFEERSINLGEGRLKGVESRKASAAKRRNTVEKAIDDLFDAPHKPGWRMTNDDITDFLVKRLPFYTSNSMLQHVKRIAAKWRATEKEHQAK